MELIVEFTGDDAQIGTARQTLEKVSGVVDLKPFAGPGEAQRAGRFLVSTQKGSDLRADIFRAAASANVTLVELTRRAELEDVFRHMTGAGA
jgi:hypothetical protein